MSKESLTKVVQRSPSDTAFRPLGVELRMNKVFSLDPGMLGSASFTSVDPRVAPVWIGDLAETSSAVQSPDAIDRNLALSLSETSSAVQSPDAIERNLEHVITVDDTPGPQLHLLGSDFAD